MFLCGMYYIYVGNFDITTWPALDVIPIQPTSIWEWYILLVSYATLDFAYTICMISATTYFVSCCFYIEAIRKHFDQLMHLAQQDVPFYNRSYGKIDELSSAIKTHVEINE